MNKTKIVNLYGGPGAGKSTAAAGLFSALKSYGVNCEYVSEYAKDKAWEFDSAPHPVPKVLQAQEYVFAKQHFRIRRCAASVDLIITDAPLLTSLLYIGEDFPLKSLRPLIHEAYSLYDNLDVMLKRGPTYQQEGRFQTHEQAKEIDLKAERMLTDQGIRYTVVPSDADTIQRLTLLVYSRWDLGK